LSAGAEALVAVVQLGFLSVAVVAAAAHIQDAL
jgi:hypothetical protein